jgi:hypothetical protein
MAIAEQIDQQACTVRSWTGLKFPVRAKTEHGLGASSGPSCSQSRWQPRENLGMWRGGYSNARPDGIYSWQLGACLPAGLITLDRPRNKRATLARAGSSRGQPRGFEMPQTLATLISYILIGITPALAQATPDATVGGVPWIWIIVGIIVVGGIWWYMRRRRV